MIPNKGYAAVAGAVGAIALLTGTLLAGYRLGAKAKQQEWDRSKLATIQLGVQQGNALALDTFNMGADLANRTENVRIETVEIVREIPKYIPSGSADLPDAWVMLHNRAASSASRIPSVGGNGTATETGVDP